MPRLTNQQYLKYYQSLSRLWHEDPHTFSYIRPIDQRRLHEYFQLSKDMTSATLLEHRKAVTKKYSSLPHEAGRALAKLDAATAAKAEERAQPRATVKRPVGSRRGKIIVSGVLKPEVDLHKLSRVMTSIMESMAEELAEQKRRAA